MSEGTRNRKTLCFVLFASVQFSVLLNCAAAEEVRLCRDTWGVPHVSAQTEAGAAFGIGYAQAEDRLEQVLRNYREAEGTQAEAFGEEYVEQDYLRRLEQHRKVCRGKYDQLPAEVRRMLEAFQAGVKQYMADHPERVPKWAPELHPSQCVAVARYVIFRWPMSTALGELGRRKEVNFDFSSNQWAVRPERTATGAAMLCIDPHIGWNGVFRFYEMRLHGGRLHISGFGPVGTPLIGVGHNSHLGWAFTTGGPDTTDIYAEQINPKNPRQYRYDGQWRDMRTENEEIRVGQTDGSVRTVVREIEYTHHGPIALREGNIAYAVACPYFDQMDLPTQLYRMCLAANLEEFNAALGMCQMMEQNCMYADDQGNIQYVRTGRVPIRPKGYDWERPVPGNTSKTEWLGLHKQADLVHLLNPPSGYMQNCNIGPDTMTRNGPIRLSDYPAYIYGVGPGQTNSRGRRAVELLDANDHLTTEAAVAIINDTHADAAEAWQQAIARAAEANRDESRVKALAPALEILAKWNGRMDKESAGASLYRAFHEQMRRRGTKARIGREDLVAGKIDGTQQRVFLEAFGAAAEYLRTEYGRLEVPWGEIQRVARGDKDFPCSGGDSGSGMTLRAVGGRLVGKKIAGQNGQSCTQLVVFKKTGAVSWSVTPWGQSDDAKSPHYSDQAEKLFSNSLLKPTWFNEADLQAGHVESKTVLTYKP
jgi:acyl-homoserine lactone acylase PvdQ